MYVQQVIAAIATSQARFPPSGKKSRAEIYV
jgi:hypothetical protein